MAFNPASRMAFTSGPAAVHATLLLHPRLIVPQRVRAALEEAPASTSGADAGPPGEQRASHLEDDPTYK
jgi:hypothetical protein